MKINLWIREEINANIDLKYLAFHSSLLPNVSKIEGVRIPILRKIAASIAKDPDVFSYLNDPICSTYEEKTIYGLTIGYLKTDINYYQKYLKQFIPMIDNWATCDVVASNLKFTKKYPKEMYDFLKPYLKSEKEYEVRFAVVMLMDYYLNENYEQVLLDLEMISCKDYYVKMAVAWLLSVGYVKHKEKTLFYLKNKTLDPWIYQKSLSKIIESNRVSKEEKEMIRYMKSML